MYRIAVNRLLYILLIFFMLIPLAGCTPGSNEDKINLRQALIEDAKNNLRATIAEDFTHLTIIKGSLGKFQVNKNNPQYIGAAIGATESMIFPEKYEIVRLTKMVDISAEIKKEIISQPMLDILNKNREVMNHIYNSVLKPLAAQVEKGNPLTAEQVFIIDNVIRLLERESFEYNNLSQRGLDFNSEDAQTSFMTVQDLNRELQKQKLPDLKSN